MSGKAGSPRGGSAALLALVLALLVTACAPAPNLPAFVVVEGMSPDAPDLPMIAVRRGDGAALTREDWLVAETAARDHCAAQGATYARLPVSRNHTEMRLEGGVFSFMARCLRPGAAAGGAGA